MSGILTSTQASGSAVTGHLCPKTDVVASKWIAIATITAVFGHTSPNEPSWRHKMLESADLARLPSDRSRKWEIPDAESVWSIQTLRTPGITILSLTGYPWIKHHMNCNSRTRATSEGATAAAFGSRNHRRILVVSLLSIGLALYGCSIRRPQL